MNNSSDVLGNLTRYNDWRPLYMTLNLALSIVEYLTISFGILLNLWVLLALLTSKDIRSRMRNKVICSFCLLHLLYSLVVLPITVDTYRGFGLYRRYHCLFYSILDHIGIMQDFIANWSLVQLLVIFVSQVCDYKPHVRFTKLATVIGMYTVLALPWIGSLITIPAVTSSTHYSLLKSWNISDYSGCIFLNVYSFRIILWLDTSIPLLVAGALLVTAVVLRRRRFTRGYSSGMQVELIDRGPEIDEHRGYTAAFVVTLVCDLPTFFIIILNFLKGWRETLIFGFTAIMLSQTKTIFTPLALLFFPDIRERLKTWRPWYNPKPGIDLTVVYKNTTK